MSSRGSCSVFDGKLRKHRRKNMRCVCTDRSMLLRTVPSRWESQRPMAKTGTSRSSRVSLKSNQCSGLKQPCIPCCSNNFPSWGTKAASGKVSKGAGCICGGGKFWGHFCKTGFSKLNLSINSAKWCSVARALMHINCAPKKPPIGTPFFGCLITTPHTWNILFWWISQLTKSVTSASVTGRNDLSQALPLRSSDLSPPFGMLK